MEQDNQCTLSVGQARGDLTFTIETVSLTQCSLTCAPQSLREDYFSARFKTQSNEQPSLPASDQWKSSYSLQDLPALTEKLIVGGDDNCLVVAQALRKLHCEAKAPISEIISAGFVPQLIAWMTRADFPQLQLEAAWALTNMAASGRYRCMAFIEMGCVPTLITMLESPNESTQEQAVWALGNLAVDSTACRDCLLESGALPFLLAFSQRAQKPSSLSDVSLAVCNLCSGRPIPQYALIACAVPVLCSFLKLQHDARQVKYCCWTLARLSNRGRSVLQQMIDADVVCTLKELIQEDAAIHVPALRILGNFTVHDADLTQYVIDIGGLDCTIELLDSPKKAVRRCAVWILSNIAAGTPSQVSALLATGVLPSLLRLLHNDSFNIKKECLWTIGNAVEFTESSQIDYFLESGVVEGFCSVLGATDDVKTHLVAMEGLWSMLKQCEQAKPNPVTERMKACEAVQKLEGLQTHSNQEVVNMAIKLMSSSIGVEH